LSSNDDGPFFTNDDDTAEDSYPRHGRIDDHLPLFVLPVYALPTITMTLVIFEPRYIAMMQRCLNSRQTMSSGEPGFGVFGMVAPQAGQEGPPRGATNPPPALRRIGTYMRITSVAKHPTMPRRFVVECLGVERFELRESWQSDEGFLVGKVAPYASLEAKTSPNAAVFSSYSRVRSHFEELTTHLTRDSELFPGLARYIAKNMEVNAMPTEPAAFAWWMAEILPLGEERYRLLESPSFEERLEVLESCIEEMEAHIAVKGVPPAGEDVD